MILKRILKKSGVNIQLGLFVRVFFIEWRLFVKTIIYIEGNACELRYFSLHVH